MTSHCKLRLYFGFWIFELMPESQVARTRGIGFSMPSQSGS